MNQSEIFHKLVNLLGRSEHDLEVQSTLTELGVKFPLKKPNRNEVDGYLIEKNKIKCHFGVTCADRLPCLRDDKNFKKNELVFSDVQNILEPDFNTFGLPFGLTWEMKLENVTELLGSPFYTPDKNWYSLWRKDDTVIRIEFYENDSIYNLGFRCVWDVDLTR